jgi:glutamine synthetase
LEDWRREMNKDQLAVLIKERNIQIVGRKFVDLLGLSQHFIVPVAELDENIWIHGLGF